MLTFGDLRDADPYGFYERQRAAGRVVWDPSLDGWLVTSVDDVRAVLQNEDVFAAPWPRMDFRDIFGARSLFMLTGDDHDAMYDRIKGFFSKKFIDHFRAKFIRPLAKRQVGQFAGRTTAELATELAQEVPVRVIGALLGLDWMGENFGREVWGWTEGFLVHTGNWILPDGGVVTQRAAEESMAKLDEMIVPVVQSELEGPHGDSYIAQLWRFGNEVFDDWTETDVVDSCRFLFVAGVHTTSELLCNVIYVLSVHPELQASVRADRSKLASLIEEVLRLFPSMHVRMRFAACDTVLGGQPVQAGDRVFSVLAAANRDPERFECPASVDLERRPISAHVTFSRGPRSCSGAPLARAEAWETIDALLEGVDEFRPDPAWPTPHYEGLLQRVFRPLHMVMGRGREVVTA